MKAKRIIYSKLISTGNYENVKVEIEMEVEKGEDPTEVFKIAKKWVEAHLKVETTNAMEIVDAMKVLADKRNHTPVQTEAAEKLISEIELQDLPF